MNLERILARLKKERHRIDKAIAALEKVRSAESNGQRGAAKAKKQRSRVHNKPDGRDTEGESQERNRRDEAKVVTFAPGARRVS